MASGRKDRPEGAPLAPTSKTAGEIQRAGGGSECAQSPAAKQLERGGADETVPVLVSAPSISRIPPAARTIEPVLTTVVCRSLVPAVLVFSQQAGVGEAGDGRRGEVANNRSASAVVRLNTPPALLTMESALVSADLARRARRTVGLGSSKRPNSASFSAAGSVSVSTPKIGIRFVCAWQYRNGKSGELFLMLKCARRKGPCRRGPRCCPRGWRPLGPRSCPWRAPEGQPEAEDRRSRISPGLRTLGGPRRDHRRGGLWP